MVVDDKDSLEKTRELYSLSGMAWDLMEGVANMALASLGNIIGTNMFIKNIL